MRDVQEFLAEAKPYILDWIAAAGAAGVSGGGAYAPSPHALYSAYHSGLLDSVQAPQFLLLDGTRGLTGNLAVDSGVTIDGVDISALAAAAITLTGSQTLQNKTLDNTNAITLKDTNFTLQDDGDTTKQAQFQLSGIATATTRVLTVPDASGTLTLLAATQNLQNKTLDNTNQITAKDTLFTLQDDGDTSKQARFQLSGISTATTRTYTLPDASDTLVTLVAAQALTNKSYNGLTLSATTGTFTLTNGKTLTVQNTLTLSGTDAKALTLTGSLTIGADTTITGGGTLALGGFTLTVPATGTAVLTSRTITEGAGLAGNVYDLSVNRTLALGTPSTLAVATSNSASGTTHSHAVTSSTAPTTASLVASDGSGNFTPNSAMSGTAATFTLLATPATITAFGAATSLSMGAATGTATLNNAAVALAGTLLTPVTTLNTDIGQLTKPFKSIYAAELRIGTLVADTYQATIGGRVLVGPTTYLIADLGVVSDTITIHGTPTTNASTANGSTASCNYPSGLSMGDVLIALVGTRASSITTPTGWTLIRNDTTGTAKSSVYYRVLDGTEASSQSWSLGSSSGWTVSMVAFSNVNNAAVVNASNGQTNGSGVVTAPSITTTVDNCMLVYCANQAGTTHYTPDAAMAEQTDIGSTGSTNCISEIATQLLTTAGATGTRAATGNTGNDSQAQLIALTPSFSMRVKHNDLNVADRAYLQANGAIEFMAVLAGPFTVSGGYQYQVTRNLDGTGANTWNAGDAVFNTGTTGNGFIDLYSLYSTVSLPLDYLYNFNNTGSAYSANYATNQNWQPFADSANTEVGDAIYFGMANTTWNNLYFTLTTAAAYSATLTWEFWNGSAWTTFVPTFVGNASGDFKAAGWQGFEWTVASLTSWAATTVNSLSAYWVRARISAFTSWTTTPTQGTYRVNRGKGQIGPTIVMWKRNSSTWNDLTETVALGNLAGLFGITVSTPGIGIGDYAGGTYLRYDAASNTFKIVAGGSNVNIDSNGIRLVQGTLTPNKVTWQDGSSNILLALSASQPGATLTSTLVSTAPSSGNTAVLNLYAQGISSNYAAYLSLIAKEGDTTFSKFSFQFNNTERVLFDMTGATFTQAVNTSGTPTALKVTGAAHTTLAASTEAIDVNFNLARTVQFAAGALATQRAAVFQAPTYGFASASTITTAATLAITGAPAAGTNATITTPLALWVQAGNVLFAGTLKVTGGLGVNGAAAQTALASGGAAPAGGTGATAGAYDTSAHRDALITLVNNMRTALLNCGIMS